MLHFVFYTDLFVPKRFGALTVGPLVFIRPRYRDTDPGLLAHELVHVRQFWRNPLMGIWYQLSQRSRLEYELEAFVAQIKCYPSPDIDWYANMLATKYRLEISKEQARQLLLDRLK